MQYKTSVWIFAGVSAVFSTEAEAGVGRDADGEKLQQHRDNKG